MFDDRHHSTSQLLLHLLHGSAAALQLDLLVLEAVKRSLEFFGFEVASFAWFSYPRKASFDLFGFCYPKRPHVAWFKLVLTTQKGGRRYFCCLGTEALTAGLLVGMKVF